MTIKVTAYRGEHGELDADNHFQSRLGALSFGTVEAAKTYASSPNNRDDTLITPRIIKAEITIHNPVMNDPDDPFIDFSIIIKAIGVEKALKIALEEEGHISNTDNWHELSSEHGCSSVEKLCKKLGAENALNQIYMDAYPVFDDPTYVSWFRDAGFDGLVQGGNGETGLMPEYKVFNPEQAKVLKVLILRTNDKDMNVDSELDC
jgi:hypothetical protein